MNYATYSFYLSENFYRLVSCFFMARIMSEKKYVLLLIAVFAFTFIFTFMVLSLPSHEMSFVSLAIIPLALTAVSTVILYSGMRKLVKDSRKRIKSTLVFSIFTFILFESIMAILTLHSIESTLLMIPADLVLLSIPLYITFKRSKGFREGDEYSSELSERLAELTGDGSHKVYIRSGMGPAMGTATDGKEWNIIILNDAFSRLNDDEIEMLMLEKYYDKIEGRSKILVYLSFGLFVLFIDLILGIYVLSMVLPAAYGVYFIPALAAVVIMGLIFPFFIVRSSVSSFRKIDEKILSVSGNRMALISLIEKESDREPVGAMTQYQYYRYKDRQKKNAQRRIRNIQ